MHRQSRCAFGCTRLTPFPTLFAPLALAPVRTAPPAH